MLVELAIGDAYGAGFEYAADRIVQEHNDLSRYIQHPHHGIPPGCYTDDTQMSLAIAEAIVEEDDWTPAVLAQRFVMAFKRDPREGYASRFYEFLLKVQDGAEFLARIRPTSDKSGAAMRACPIGVFPTVSEVIDRCRIQAALTHNTPDGTNAAVATALMTHYCLYQLGAKAELTDFLCDHVPGDWRSPWQGKVGGQGMMSVRAAVTAMQASNSMSELLKTCVAFTGDVDTVAAIALGAGTHAVEIEPDLPEHLFTGLENGQFGRAYLQGLDDKLRRKFGLTRQ
ncbi:MAG: ADP-ribosylglycohydrolase family protein [Synechococcales bacterium]|nr:ADP-ribosylglycohydrolase family protein [Synechococcales bacterium]